MRIVFGRYRCLRATICITIVALSVRVDQLHDRITVFRHISNGGSDRHGDVFGLLDVRARMADRPCPGV